MEKKNFQLVKKLVFTRNGAILLHTTENDTVVVWNVIDRQLRYTRPGSLIGVSRDGKTFLTHLQEDRFSAWNTVTGTEIELEDIEPESYELYQRTVILADEFELTLRAYDLLNVHPPRLLRVSHPAHYGPTLDTWAMAPNNQDVVVTLWGDVAGHDWASGQCINLASGVNGTNYSTP